MRTTLTLDDDVAAKLKAEMKKSGATFREVVNSAIRNGLVTAKRRPSDSRPVKLNHRPLGLRPGLNYESFSELLEQIEGPFHR